MDNSTLDNLLTARRLFAIADQQSQTTERHACTAGLIILQDALELVFIACLTEKKLGKPATFDGIIDKLEENGCTILNKPKLQGINKIRVPAKHYGIIIDQYILKDALNKSMETVEYLIFTVFGKPYHQIYSAELIQHPETKALLEESAKILEAAPFYPYACLMNIRKAIFINFEEEYSIEEWRNIKREQKLSLVEDLTYRKSAPSYTRNKEWIEQHVPNLLDYIQFDYGELRSRLNEYGIAWANFFNLLRLTPRVFRSKKETKWKAEGNPAFMQTSKETASYCLSMAIEMILLKESYIALHRPAPEEFKLDIKIAQPTFIYRKASLHSEKIQKLEQGEMLSANAFVPSFDDDSHFLYVAEWREHPKAEWLVGYIPEKHIYEYEENTADK